MPVSSDCVPGWAGDPDAPAPAHDWQIQFVMNNASGLIYDSLIWDWNGTLLDDIALVVEIVNEILVDHRLSPMSRDRYRELFDFPVEHYYERAGMDLSAIDFEDIGRRFHRVFEERLGATDLFPEARAALAAVGERGVRQYLLSSTEHYTLVQTVGSFGIDELFDDIRGIGDRLARGKTQAGRELIAAHNIDPSRALMVGDTCHDWEVAQACGMDCVLLSTGHQSHDRLAALGCPVFDTIEAIPAWLVRRSTAF